MNFGIATDRHVPCYVIVDSGQTISLLFNFDDYSQYTSGTTNVYVEFYGNLLVSTGRSLNFEPGTNPMQLKDAVK